MCALPFCTTKHAQEEATIYKLPHKPNILFNKVLNPKLPLDLLSMAASLPVRARQGRDQLNIKDIPGVFASRKKRSTVDGHNIHHPWYGLASQMSIACAGKAVLIEGSHSPVGS